MLEICFDKFPERRQRIFFVEILFNLLIYVYLENTSDKYKFDIAERNLNISESFNVGPYIERNCPEYKNLQILCLSILKWNNHHSYKPTIAQTLVTADDQRRTEFCRWYVSKCQRELMYGEGL